MVDRHNADLANGLGNLASRVLAMLGTNYDGVVPEPTDGAWEADLPAVIAEAVERYDEHLLAVRLTAGLAAVWDIVSRANQYLVEKEPWQVAKDPARGDELAGVLYAAAETLRILAILIQPIMPGPPSGSGISSAWVGRSRPAASPSTWRGVGSNPGPSPSKGEALFPRVEAD
jgi:methionyl-tRNA synthetase